jgi:thiamine-monophosphate kinase
MQQRPRTAPDVGRRTPRTLADVGELGLVARIERAARAGPRGGVVLGIGDDAALLRARPGEDLVATTDALVEGTHFRWDSDDAEALGWRALVANLSDLAAMGARPLGCLLALAAPGELPLARLDALLAGLLAAARAFACPLAGGNLARARETSLGITALGAVRRGRALLRRGARAGDRVLVTGCLGAAALARARADRGLGPVALRPRPRLEAGAALTRTPGVGACIDVSDGLELDLSRLLAAAARGPRSAELHTSRIPLPRGFHGACAELGLDPLELALGGGEDYELLFTARPGAPSESALSRRLGVRVTELGRVRAGGRSGGRSGGPSARGFRHF